MSKVVISGFAGVGKSTAYNALKVNSRFPVYDSDSSHFGKDGFPQNYIDHIKSLPDNSVVFVSCHDVVRQALHEEGIEFTLVYPELWLANEYQQRYLSRGGHPLIVEKVMDMWWDFIASCDEDKTQDKIVLKAGEYLTPELVNDIVDKKWGLK